MSQIPIKVVPRAKENVVTERDGLLIVRVTAPAEDGKANAKVLSLLAEYWHVPKSTLTIVRGATSRQKVIENLTPVKR